jgi:glycosyltransferase 2 family protein
MAVQESSPVPLAASGTGRRRAWRRHLAGLVITVICLAMIVRQVDVRALGEALVTFQWPYLIPAVVALAFGYGMRIMRWSLMLRAAGAQVATADCAAPFLGSIALNNVLPLRLGDVVRALVFPAAIGVTRALATSSLVMERLVDLMTLLICLAVGVAIGGHGDLPDWLVRTAVTLAVTGAVALVLTFAFSGMLADLLRLRAARARPAIGRLLVIAADLLAGCAAMVRLRVLLALVGLSALVWAGESGLFYFILRGFGLDADLALAAVVMAVATLATLVPSSPGYVGPFHLAAYTAVSMLGSAPAMAASFALVAHLALWLPTTLAGATAILLSPRLFSGIRGSACSS